MKKLCEQTLDDVEALEHAIAVVERVAADVDHEDVDALAALTCNALHSFVWKIVDVQARRKAALAA